MTNQNPRILPSARALSTGRTSFVNAHRKLATAVVVAAMALSAACFRHTLIVPGTAPASVAPAYSAWHHSFIIGLINASGEVDLKKVCPSGVNRIEDEWSFLNGVVSWLTSYIYTPTTVEVWCAAGTSPVAVEIKPDAAKMARVRAMFPNLDEQVVAARAEMESVRVASAR